MLLGDFVWEFPFFPSYLNRNIYYCYNRKPPTTASLLGFFSVLYSFHPFWKQEEVITWLTRFRILLPPGVLEDEEWMCLHKWFLPLPCSSFHWLESLDPFGICTGRKFSLGLQNCVMYGTCVNTIFTELLQLSKCQNIRPKSLTGDISELKNSPHFHAFCLGLILVDNSVM